MSSTTGLTPAPAPIHVSWWAKASTWVLHEATTAKNIFAKIATEMPAVDAEIKKLAPTAEGMAALVSPKSVGFLDHVVNVWSTAAATIDSVDASVSANGISIPLDAAMVASIKSFIPTVKAQMSPAASASPAAPPVPAQ